jgi:rubrerythrin
MKRLIDADALLKRAIEERKFVFYREDMLDMTCVFNTVYKDLADFINEAPTVEERFHASWIPKKIYGPDMYSKILVWSCSHCGWSIQGNRSENPEPPYMSYCPDCGAKMGGDEDD